MTMYNINYMYEISLNNVLSNVYKVSVTFVTDVPTSGIYGLNPPISITFMCSHVSLMVSYYIYLLSSSSGW